MANTMVGLAFLQPSGTHKNTNKSNVFLSMLFYLCYFWSVGSFLYMGYGICYVVNGMVMAFTVYSLMFYMHHSWAVYNVYTVIPV